MVTIFNFISYGLPKVSPSHLYKEETFILTNTNYILESFQSFQKKKKSFAMGQSDWLIAKTKQNKQ
jgi:hypothetical protein